MDFRLLLILAILTALNVLTFTYASLVDKKVKILTQMVLLLGEHTGIKGNKDRLP